MYAHVVSLGVTGLDGYPVTVEPTSAAVCPNLPWWACQIPP